MTSGGILALLTAVWPVAMLLGRQGNVYVILGAFSLVVLLVTARPADLPVRPPLRAIGLGIALGVILGGVTEAVVGVGVAASPWLAGLLRGALSVAPGPLGLEVLGLVAIVAAEERLWRVAWTRWLEDRGLSPLAAIGASAAIYTVAQVGTGAPLVWVVAAVLGTLWGLERRWLGSALAPLMTHLVWDLWILVFRPIAP